MLININDKTDKSNSEMSATAWNMSTASNWRGPRRAKATHDAAIRLSESRERGEIGLSLSGGVFGEMRGSAMKEKERKRGKRG